MLFVVVVFFAAALALAFAAFNFAAVKKMPEGTERMSEIAAAIRVGANAFINYEYRILAIVVACIAVLMAIITTWHAAAALLIGAVMSASAGFIGMKIATYANVRVSNRVPRLQGRLLLPVDCGGHRHRRRYHHRRVRRVLHL